MPKLTEPKVEMSLWPGLKELQLTVKLPVRTTAELRVAQAILLAVGAAMEKQWPVPEQVRQYSEQLARAARLSELEEQIATLEKEKETLEAES